MWSLSRRDEKQADRLCIMKAAALIKLRLLKASLVWHAACCMTTTTAFALDLVNKKPPAQNKNAAQQQVVKPSNATPSIFCSTRRSARLSASRKTNVLPKTSTITSSTIRPRAIENCTRGGTSRQYSRRRCIVSAWSLMSSSMSCAWSSSSPQSSPCSGSKTRTFFIGVPVAQAAETIGKDENCNDSSCLGVWDGLLADCPHGKRQIGAGCTSSQDDTPGIFAEPWDYSETTNIDFSSNWSEEQMNRLVSVIKQVAAQRGDNVRIILQQGRYLRVVFKDGNTGEASVGEFYFTPSDTTVQFRIASLLQIGSGGGGGTKSLLLSPSSSQKNMERAESIRKQLGFLKLPVLRNRKRSLFFVESDFDTFGPGSAMLGPPAEMSAGDFQGRQDMDKAFPFR
jgi:Protein of unknown function (DUF1499)